jgi:Carboxypeptidase regulatory-like domain
MHRKSGWIRPWTAVVVAASFAFGCATAPAPDPDSTVLWGYLRLLPKAGSQARGGGYGDRRVAEAKRVDYSQIQFAVVYVPSARSESPSPAELAIRASDRGSRIDPHYAATSPAAGIRITNATASPQIVSVPGAARLERVAAGESVLIPGLAPGESTVHLLGVPEGDATAPAQVWVTEGVTALVDASGRYALRGLEPGRHQVRAWHPRLPPSSIYAVDLTRGSVLRLDLEIGLDSTHADAGGRP